MQELLRKLKWQPVSITVTRDWQRNRSLVRFHYEYDGVFFGAMNFFETVKAELWQNGIFVTDATINWTTGVVEPVASPTGSAFVVFSVILADEMQADHDDWVQAVGDHFRKQ